MLIIEYTHAIHVTLVVCSKLIIKIMQKLHNVLIINNVKREIRVTF